MSGLFRLIYSSGSSILLQMVGFHYFEMASNYILYLLYPSEQCFYCLFFLSLSAFPIHLSVDPNRLEFSMKIQDMLAKIEKRISKYLKYLKQCIAFFGSIFLHVSI